MTAQTAAKPTAIPQTPSLPQAKPESLGLSAVRLQRMSDAFKREIDKGTLPGATVLVAGRGQIGWCEALGKQNPAASAPMANDSIFRIFSMTKPIVSVASCSWSRTAISCSAIPHAKFIGICRPEGRRREQRQARPRAAEAADDDPGLLRHTSGITYDHTGNGLVQQMYAAVAAAQPQGQQCRARRDGRRHALMCQPGAEWNYSRSTDISAASSKWSPARASAPS